MHIYGIVDLLAAAFVLASDISAGWFKWGVLGILLIKGLHSQFV
jgi:hypothetical protein